MPYYNQQARPVVELVGLRLPNRDDLKTCVQVYLDRHPGGYLGSIGQNTAIIAKKYLPRLIGDLQERGVQYSEFDVRSVAELRPEELAKLRRQRGTAEHPDFQDRRKVLEELRREYGVL